MKKTPAKKTPRKKPHAPAYTRKEIARLKALAANHRTLGNPWDKVESVSHITPRAFCVAKTHAHCAVFAVPTCDREPQVCQSHYTTVQHKSCADVETGDWCAIAYVMTRSSGQPVVLEILQPAKP